MLTIFSLGIVSVALSAVDYNHYYCNCIMMLILQMYTLILFAPRNGTI